MKKFRHIGSFAASSHAANAWSASTRMRSIVAALAAVLLPLLAVGRAHAQGVAAGAVDTTFGSAQTFNAADKVLAIAMQADGKIVVGGNFTSINGVAVQRIARLNADGTLDTTFNPGAPNGDVRAVAVQSDGKIIAGGSFATVGGASRSRIARFNTDGTLDADFVPVADSIVEALAIDSSGKVIVGGSFANMNATARSRIARLNTDGTLDTAFDPSATGGTVFGLTLQSDGSILVGGTFTAIAGSARTRIARINSDGSSDATFNGNGVGANGQVSAITVQSDGKILIGGLFTAVNGLTRNRITRLNADGSVDTGFLASGTDGDVYAIAVDSDGKIVIGGGFGLINGSAAPLRLGRLNSDGSRDTAFNSGGAGVNGIVRALGIQSSGKIVVGGEFTTLNGVTRSRMARINADGTDAEAVYWGTTSPGGQVYAVATQSDGKVLIGGSFTSVNTVTRNRIARFNADGTLDTSFNPGTGPNAFVNAIAIDASGKILIAGNFTSYNGTARSYAARLNSDGTLDTTFAIPGAGLNNQIRAIAVQSDGKIVLGGEFVIFDGSTRNYMVRVDSTGALDTAFNPAPNNIVRALAIDSSGKILVGGSFTSIAGATRGRIARLNADGTSDSAFAPSSGADAHVHALALQSDGKVVIGGEFLNCNGATRTRIARLTSAGANDTGFSPAANSTVFALQTMADGKIIAGGAFQTIAGVSRNRIARLNSDGSIDTGFDVGTGANGNVLAFAMDYNGRLLMGGAFTLVSGLGRMSVARIGNGAFTVTLSGQTIAGGTSILIPSLRGNLTGASIDLTARSGDSYSADLTLVVTPTSAAPSDNPKNALAQIGGYWGDFVGNSNRLYWVPQSMEDAVPLRAGPVNLLSSYDLTANSAYRVWITNGFTAGPGTFTATITLHGVTGAAYYPDGDGDGYGNSSGTPVYAMSGTVSGSGEITFTGVPAGYVANNTDCNDSNSAINPGAAEVCDASNVDEDCDSGADDADPQGNASGRLTYYRDQDGDGYSINTTALFCDTPSGYILTLSSPADCNDTNAAVNPSATEICDGLDNDCNSVVDDGMTMLSYYTDADGDGYGATTASAQSSCTPVSGKVTNNTDCNDGAAGINPGATEVCDSLNTDEDCDSLADNADPSASAATKSTFYVDADGDTHTTSATGAFCDLPSGYRAALSSPVDCNDADAAIYPGAVENCANLGTDNDCDGVNDAAEAVDSLNYYTDADADGYGASTATAQKSCSAVSGKVTSNTDCNDGNAAINPAATEICDPLDTDEDCDTLADNADSSASAATKSTFYRDQDNDGHSINTTALFCDLPSGYSAALSSPVDCADTNAAIYPGAAENCANDGTDNDCDGVNDAAEAVDSVNYYTDADSDSYGASTATAQKSCSAVSGKVTNNTDCDDALDSVHPGALENCANDGVDNDCDGEANADSEAVDSVAYYVDGDADGFGAQGAAATMSCTAITGSAPSNTDCNDAAAAINPAATEVCDGVNNDCDGQTDEGFPDTDGDSRADCVDDDANGDGVNDAYSLALVTQPVAGLNGAALTTQPVVEIRDLSGAVVTNSSAAVTASIFSGSGGTLGGTTTVRAVNGVATFTNLTLSGSPMQSFVLRFSSSGLISTQSPHTYDKLAPGGGLQGNDKSWANTYRWGQRFTATHDGAITAAKLNLYRRNSQSGVFTIEIWSDSAGGTVPSASLATLGTFNWSSVPLNNGSTNTSATFNVNAPSNNYRLTRNTNYWLVVNQAGTGPDAKRWSVTDSGNQTAYYYYLSNWISAGTTPNLGAQVTLGLPPADSSGISPVHPCQSEPNLAASALGTDGDGDGYCSTATGGTDCGDASTAIYPGATENCANLGTDNDCDGVNDAAEAVDSVAYYVDGDSDGYGAGSATMSCSAVSGSVTNATDCDDSRSGVNPAAQEVCDAADRDEDCDGVADNADSSASAATKSTFYRDQDNDGHSVNTTALFCDLPSGYKATLSSPVDCDDASASVYPGATENCANLGTDNDCDGVNNAAEAVDSVTYFVDSDNDLASVNSTAKFCTAPTSGYRATLSSPVDCDDADAAIYPGAAENCANDGTDNDCDGEANADSEAVDSTTYYRDADGDGAGDPSTTVQSCTQVTGYLTVAGDTCPSDPLKLSPGQCGCGNLDTDSDGDGTANCNDLCPNDPSKVVPGACGCGIADVDADASGTADCLEANPVVSMSVTGTEYQPGDTVSVRIATTATGLRATSVQLAVRFDPTRLLLSSTSTVAGSAFTASTLETIDNTNGTLKLTLSAPSGSIGGAQLATLDFVVLQAPATCSEANIVAFGAVGAYVTRFATDIGVNITPSTTGLAAIRLDGDGPVLSGIPSSASIAADAGSTYGAYVAAPTVTASDTCDGTRTVTLLVTYPDSSTGSSWPTGGMFPIGTTTLRWDTDDTLGNASTETRTIAVANHQLLDLSMTLFGGMSGASTRSIRVKAGASTQIVPVNFTVSGAVGSATATGVQVPVAAGYSCVSVKDAVHSLTKTAVPAISGARYTASMLLRQGDSNDDDMVDIVDFGMFVADRGAGKAPDARSNFNSDGHVGTGDFSFLTLSFFRVGESCTGAFDGAQPRTRVSVKDLRRAGLGDAAAGDVNRDGWVDMRDVQAVLQGIEAAQAGQESGGAPPRW